MAKTCALIPTVPERTASLARTVMSYEKFSPEVDLQIVTGYDGTGPAWNEWLPKLAETYDYIHCGVDDVTVTEGWLEEAMYTWQKRRMPCPKVIHMPVGTVESHGKWGANHSEPTEVYWCGVPFLTSELAAKIGPKIPPIHYFSDNVICCLLSGLGVGIYAMPNYVMEHWHAEGGVQTQLGKWEKDEAIFHEWYREFLQEVMHDSNRTQ